MVKTNVQCLANKVEIDFEWELLTVIRRKQIHIYWWQFELVIAARTKCNYCWNIEMGVVWSSLFSFASFKCFCKTFSAPAVTSFYFCSLTDGWNERIDQTIAESHINLGGFGQMGDGNSLTEHSACHLHIPLNLSFIVLWTSVSVSFIYSNDSFHSARFDVIPWGWKSCQSSTSFDIQFAIFFCSSYIPACYPHYHHCWNGLCSPV